MGAARLASIFFVFAFQAVSAQQPHSWRASIHVVDETGATIPSATIEIWSASGSRIRESRADNVGQLSIELPEGRYELIVSQLGFEKWRGLLALNSQTEQNLNVPLKAEVGGTWGDYAEPEIIPVEHATPLIQIPLQSLYSLVSWSRKDAHRSKRF